MKKMILFFLLLSCADVAFAQFDRGGFLVGGTITGSYSSDTDISPQYDKRTLNVNITPQAGYFILNRLAVGIGVGFGNKDITYRNFNRKDYDHSLSGVAFLRCYPYKGLFMHGQASVGNLNHQDNDNGLTRYKAKTIGTYVGVGYAILLNKYVAFEPLIGYRTDIIKITAVSSKIDASGLFLQFGLQFYLHR